ncbi:SprT-like family-domain-containing protein [Dichomitus squalens]|uniref:SprT-like domain-containing protein n=1 Tax=Dichomitus squalens (strain LYAD-421) TaxID=732165 RepID=R7SR75_DICSQ|nr:uncharacterized protein DICSQDRAFT_67028 [Dichomitus squalens LYAD-421 SS1]EJF58453.1 hypothetical protein DICSQDRAFT_67028 [Dichomitus squalens LYAD-421 SS1]TBU36263.1 SprT-like family-domain-containing protein [Dichomitus squalens]
MILRDEPRSTQKPIRRPNPASASGLRFPAPSAPRRGPSKLRSTVSSDSSTDSESEVASIVKPRPRGSGSSRARATTTDSPAPSAGRLPGKIPRMTKKALLQLELERRRAYAQTFFNELNESVFAGGIPANTELQWNKRLLTTAGRAHWHSRTKDGNHITSIQLAEKILDCDERIRNTLSHEMCHLACWIIDEAPSENHGSLFKRWANKIMRKRSEIEVTTRHNYDIKCKYEWKCENCAKVYGRHSKSINPDEQACGVCKTGRLVPQFQTRRAPPRTPKPKADSQNAAARSRGTSQSPPSRLHVTRADTPVLAADSPIVMPGAFPSPTPSPAARIMEKVQPYIGPSPSIDPCNDADSDIEILAHTLKDISISGAK